MTSPEVHAWLERRNSRAGDWPVPKLVDAKGTTKISVVLPARDEASTVGSIVRVIHEELMTRAPLVDELVVVDSRSTDATAKVAGAAGARVVRQDDVLADLPAMSGKGDALWKGLAATDGDLVVFVDADLRGFDPKFVTGLLGPLLFHPDTAYVKGYYRRPLTETDRVVPDGGGRVTELVARPLFNLYLPALAGFIQPLAGEYAGRREVLERVPFVTGYGVEVGLLIDLLALVGLDGLAQVDLGERVHRHQDNESLGQMSAQILLTVFGRLERHGALSMAEPPKTLLSQFRLKAATPGTHHELIVNDIGVAERPPLAALRAAGADPSAGGFTNRR